jgi:hypothetical protein
MASTYLTSNSYTVMLEGGTTILRGACGTARSIIVAGGPPNRACPGPPGAGTAPAGAINWWILTGPVATTPVRSSSHSCDVSDGLITEIAIRFRSALSAAKTSSG